MVQRETINPVIKVVFKGALLLILSSSRSLSRLGPCVLCLDLGLSSRGVLSPIGSGEAEVLASS